MAADVFPCSVFIQMNPLRYHLWHTIFMAVNLWLTPYCHFLLHWALSRAALYIHQIRSENKDIGNFKAKLSWHRTKTSYFGPSSPRSITFNATKDPFFALCVSVEALHSWLYIISLFSGLAVFSVVGCGCVVSTGWELHQLWLRLHTNYVLLIPTNYIPGNSQNLEK